MSWPELEEEGQRRKLRKLCWGLVSDLAQLLFWVFVFWLILGKIMEVWR